MVLLNTRVPLVAASSSVAVTKRRLKVTNTSVGDTDDRLITDKMTAKMTAVLTLKYGCPSDSMGSTPSSTQPGALTACGACSCSSLR